MGENKNSFFDNTFLKNIKEEIIDFNLKYTPVKVSPSTTRTSTVSKLENYVDKKYGDTAESRHEKEILLELS